MQQLHSAGHDQMLWTGRSSWCRWLGIREAKDETISWILWFNRTRMHSTLNYVSPMQFEQDWTNSTMTIAG
jgi:transposase InsO family protein